jgi:hypothetical protein
MTTGAIPQPRLQQQRQPRSTERIVTYVVIVAVLLALAAVGVARHRYSSASADATAKATQLEQKWQAAGLSVPSRDVIVRMYGTDGGVLCTIQPTGTAKALYLQQLANGASGAGQRAVTVPRDVVVGQRAMLEVYCPERLAAFDRIVEQLKLSSGS